AGPETRWRRTSVSCSCPKTTLDRSTDSRLFSPQALSNPWRTGAVPRLSRALSWCRRTRGCRSTQAADVAWSFRSEMPQYALCPARTQFKCLVFRPKQLVPELRKGAPPLPANRLAEGPHEQFLRNSGLGKSGPQPSATDLACH